VQRKTDFIGNLRISKPGGSAAMDGLFLLTCHDGTPPAFWFLFFTMVSLPQNRHRFHGATPFITLKKTHSKP
jgi:hypothetical protein